MDRPRSRYNYKPSLFFYTNSRINATQMRVIGVDGSQVGILDKNSAINEAQKAGLDLVLIAPNAKPPVAKIIDYKKFLYSEGKKLKESKKGAKKSTVKDVQVSLFIGPEDFDRMINRGKEFIDAGNQLRVNLTLRGREVVKREMAIELVNRFIQNLGDVNISKEPRIEGRVVRAVVSKKK